MGFLVFDGAACDAITDGESHFYRCIGDGYPAGVPGDGLVGDALGGLGEKEYGRSKKAKEEQKGLPEYLIFHKILCQQHFFFL